MFACPLVNVKTEKVTYLPNNPERFVATNLPNLRKFMKGKNTGYGNSRHHIITCENNDKTYYVLWKSNGSIACTVPGLEEINRDWPIKQILDTIARNLVTKIMGGSFYFSLEALVADLKRTNPDLVFTGDFI